MASIEVRSTMYTGLDKLNDRHVFKGQDLDETLEGFLTKCRSQFEIPIDAEFTVKIKASWEKDSGETDRGI